MVAVPISGPVLAFLGSLIWCSVAKEGFQMLKRDIRSVKWPLAVDASGIDFVAPYRGFFFDEKCRGFQICFWDIKNDERCSCKDMRIASV